MKLRKLNIDSIIFDFRIQQEGLLCFPFPAVFFFHGCLMPFPAVAAVIWIMCQCIRKGKIVPAFPALPLDPPRCAGPLSGFLLLSEFFPAVLADRDLNRDDRAEGSGRIFEQFPLNPVMLEIWEFSTVYLNFPNSLFLHQQLHRK